IEYSSVDKEIKSMVITSANPSEGKSTTIANLAIVFAQQGKKVLIIDTDLRKPTVHYTFKLSNLNGIVQVLTKQIRFEDAVQETEIDNLFVLTSGSIPPNPAELLSSVTMQKFVEHIREDFDMIFFDAPPVLAVADAQILANLCDASSLVIASGQTEIDAAMKAKEMLQQSSSKFLGVILNGKEMKSGEYYYYYGTKK
ncbi:MAG TPA: CpsD/CapB family tyrosine-protein kinase, partial [Massilibacterium sp.]|nr:CpsD/CapB family tyrosine-protein kinase [Massilibacterium sp.]